MHRHFATVCSRIMQFSPKCSKKTTVYQPMQNVNQFVKCSLINSRNWMSCCERRHLRVNMAHLTVEDRSLIKTSQTKKAELLQKWERVELLCFRDAGRWLCDWSKRCVVDRYHRHHHHHHYSQVSVRQSQRQWCYLTNANYRWLPDSMRDPAIIRDSFRRSLKTFLFSAYLCT